MIFTYRLLLVPSSARLLVASFESLEISAPDNVFRCITYLVGEPTSNQCKRLKTPPKPKRPH